MKNVNLEQEEIPAVEFPELSARTIPCKERLVDVTTICPEILVDMQYIKQGIPGAVKQCLMRETAAKMLFEAGRLLPNGYRFLIYDAWRPLAVQMGLYEQYRNQVCEQYPEASEEEIGRLTAFFVSLPSADPDKAPAHTTGGAVDLTIVDDQGQPLDMGTEFDSFMETAHTAYFEKQNGKQAELIKKNRRLLYHVMTAAGFTNLPTEWWHYDYGDRFWAYYKGQDAIYDGIPE
jgi:D-alanyl-D-alanine dipeptidase